MNPAAQAEPRDLPMCPRHLERQAVRTCGRCGQFVCSACLARGEVCASCQVKLLGELPSSAGRATWARRFFGLNVISEGIGVLAAVVTMVAGAESVVGGSLMVLSGLTTLVAFVGAVITFLRWEHLAFKRALALGVDVGLTPGWAVGWWFIPFANLARPYRALRDLHTALTGDPLAAGRANIGLWWGFWIASNVLSNIETRLELSGESAVLMALLSGIASAAAALLAMGVVRAIQTALDARTAPPAAP